MSVLVEILADGKEVERDELRVKVASRGIELGRAYFRLFERGLILERDLKPGFFKKLLGSKAGRFVSLSPTAVEFFDAKKAYLDDAEVRSAEVETAPPARTQRGSDAVEVRPIEPPSVTAEVSAPQISQRRFSPTDYTEEIGGTPDDPLMDQSDNELIQGLTELLSLLGFELTPAGRLLAGARTAANVSEAEIALEILVAAVAHASRLALMGTVKIAEGPARSQIAEINKVFSHFVEEQALAQSVLDAAVKNMSAFVALTEQSASLDAYLADAMRGLAPPAVCPDEMFIKINIDDDDAVS